MDWTRGSSPSSFDAAEAVDAACDRFEADWRAGRTPRIEDYLADQPPANRVDLVRELIALEVELRRQAGEQVVAEEYEARFPAEPELVRRAFELIAQPAPAVAGQSPGQIQPAGKTGLPQVPKGGEPVRFGDYELLEEVARGGMGVVYRARQVSLNRIVAVKMILSGRFASATELRRFQREAEVAAGVDDPAIVPIYETGEVEGQPFFSMKWIEGGNLLDHLGRYVGDPIATAKLLFEVARGVQSAHERGIIHRDLKPANILIDRQGHAHLTDFGLARRLDTRSVTQSGDMLGTPSYMSPEQALGQTDLTPASDVHSLGAILYEMLTGQPPYRGTTLMDIVLLVIEHEPTPPRRLRREIPESLESICLQCLEKSPERRYPTAGELATDLAKFLRGERLSRGSGLWSRLRRGLRRESELGARWLGLTSVIALTQWNYLSRQNPDDSLHLGTLSILGAWLACSWLFHRVTQRFPFSRWPRAAWMLSDMILITAVLRLLNAESSSMVVGYTLLIVASGLSCRVGLVWFSTVLAVLCYLGLTLDPWNREIAPENGNHPNIVIAVFLVMGYLMVNQVQRLQIFARLGHDAKSLDRETGQPSAANPSQVQTTLLDTDEPAENQPPAR